MTIATCTNTGRIIIDGSQTNGDIFIGHCESRKDMIDLLDEFADTKAIGDARDYFVPGMEDATSEAEAHEAFKRFITNFYSKEQEAA